MSWAWRHSRRISGVPALVRGGPPRAADGASGRAVRRPDGTAARGSFRARGRVLSSAASAGFAVRRPGDRPAAGSSAGPATSRVTGRPFGLSADVPGSGSVSAISSCGTGCAGTGHAGVGIGAGGRSAAGAGPSGAGGGPGDGGCGTATQPAVRSTESRRNVVRRGCMEITVPEPAGLSWRLGPGPPSWVNPVLSYRQRCHSAFLPFTPPHTSRRVLTRSRGRPCVSWR